jgi:hypothetical protein
MNIKDLSARSGLFRRLANVDGWIVGGQLATVLGSLELVSLLTGYLDPAQYSLLSLGLTLAALVNQEVMGRVGAVIGLFYSTQGLP